MKRPAMSGMVLQKLFPIIPQNNFEFMNHSVTISHIATGIFAKGLMSCLLPF